MDATQTSSAPRSGVWLWILLAVVAAALLGYLLIERPMDEQSGTEGPAIGRRLPYLQLEGLTGDAADVSLDDLQGRVTLLN